jgi:hypothetical protein
MSAASREPQECRPAYRALCGNLGFLSEADDLSAFRDERGPQLARLGVKLLHKLTHAGVEPIMRGLRAGGLIAVINRPRGLQARHAENCWLCPGQSTGSCCYRFASIEISRHLC